MSEPSACPKCQHKYPHHNFGCEDYDAMRHTPTAQPSDEHVCPACRGTGRTDNIAYTPPPAQPSDEELAAKVLRQMGDGFMPTSDDELHHYGAECSFQSRAAGREQGRREVRSQVVYGFNGLAKSDAERNLVDRILKNIDRLAGREGE